MQTNAGSEQKNNPNGDVFWDVEVREQRQLRGVFEGAGDLRPSAEAGRPHLPHRHHQEGGRGWVPTGRVR